MYFHNLGSLLVKVVKIGPTSNPYRIAVATKDFKAGTVIAKFGNEFYAKPNMHTICIRENLHAVPTEGLKYMSHACGNLGNCRVSLDMTENYGTIELKKDIYKGEEFSFNYNSTEWELSCPFQCTCPKCVSGPGTNKVLGFKYLSPQERMEIIKEISPYVSRKAAEISPFFRPKVKL